MATPRAAEHRDLEQRLRNLEGMVRELTGAALRRRQLAVTEGDFVVSGGGNIVILGADGTPVWDALAGPLKPTTARADDDAVKIADTWTTYGATSVPVPAGYTKGHIMMMVSAGHSFDAGVSGNVSVQPRAFGSGIGPAVNSGNGTVSVANSFGVMDFAGVGAGTAWPTIDLSVYAVRVGAAPAGSGNWHLAASVIFTR